MGDNNGFVDDEDHPIRLYKFNSEHSQGNIVMQGDIPEMGCIWKLVVRLLLNEGYTVKLL